MNVSVFILLRISWIYFLSGKDEELHCECAVSYLHIFYPRDDDLITI